MPSCPMPSVRRAGAQNLPRSVRLSCALALALFAASCSGTHETAPATPEPERPAPTRAAAKDLAYTATSEIRFTGELVGYLVDVQLVPAGVLDGRPWEPGTALIQDKDFQFIGFISPRGTTYRFGAHEAVEKVGFGSRSTGIAAFFRRNGEPQLVSIHVGA